MMVFILRFFLIVSLILLFLFPVLDTFAVNEEEITYILPYGYPFYEPSLSAKKVYSIKLRFGMSISAVKIFQSNNFIWFMCHKIGDDERFFLPDVFVYYRHDKSRVRDFIVSGLMDRDESAGTGTERYNSYNSSFSRISDISTAPDVISIGIDFPVDKWHPVPLFYEPEDLISIPARYKAPSSVNRDLKLRKEALYWFIEMIDDAENEGIEIKIISAYRSSAYQAILYRRAIKNHGLRQTWVAKPGYSEHQLGTTCDLGTAESGYKLTVDFEHTRAFRWLMENSYRYGIYLSYPKNSAWLKGYNYEPWHFRYKGKSRFNIMSNESETFFTR